MNLNASCYNENIKLTIEFTSQEVKSTKSGLLFPSFTIS